MLPVLIISTFLFPSHLQLMDKYFVNPSIKIARPPNSQQFQLLNPVIQSFSFFIYAPFEIIKHLFILKTVHWAT
jgi:hypothetical protein